MNKYVTASGYAALAYGSLVVNQDLAAAVKDAVQALQVAGLSGVLKNVHGVLGVALATLGDTTPAR